MQPGVKMVQEQRHYFTRKGHAPAFSASLSASSVSFRVLLILLWFVAACSRGLGMPADSVQTTLGGDASSTSAKSVTREKIILQGVKFTNDGSGLRPDSQPIVDSAVELLKSQSDLKVYVDAYCDPTVV